MAVRHRVLWLIITLYYIAIVHSTLLNINDAESCDLLCKQCNAIAVFVDDRCECNLSDNNNKGAECVQRIQREIEAIDLNILSEDSTDEERGVRSILKSRRRLRVGDADKVAQYFINEGPAAGHSHFIKAFNEAYDSADSATNSFSGVLDKTNKPENEFYGEISLNSPISWNTCDSPLYMVEETGSHPAISDAEIPIVRMINPALSYSANILYDAAGPLVGSIIHPYRPRPHHHTLHRTDGAPGILYNLFNHHRWSPGHHRPVYYGRSSNDGNPVLTSQLCENDDGSTASKDFPTIESNTNKPVDQNVAANIPRLSKPTYHSIIPYFFDANAVYQPIQYGRFNIPYTSYPNPLIKVFHPVTEEYVVGSGYIPQYVHDLSDPLITAPNPNSYCKNNADTEQKDEVSTDTTVYSNNKVQQSNNVNNISTAEKNENNKSY